MPRLRKPEPEQLNAKLRALIAYQTEILGYNTEQMAQGVGLCTRTYNRRRRYPDEIRVKELRALCRKLKITDRQVCEVLGVTYHGTTPSN